MSGIIAGLETRSELLKQSVKIDLIVDLSAKQNSLDPMISLLPSTWFLRVFFSTVRDPSNEVVKQCIWHTNLAESIDVALRVYVQEERKLRVQDCTPIRMFGHVWNVWFVMVKSIELKNDCL